MTDPPSRRSSSARRPALRPRRRPHPASYFGHEIGADRTVLDWDKVVGYFQALAKSSDRIRVEELGKSTEGRPFIAATIADPETLRHLDRYIARSSSRLADPRKTTPAEAEALIAQGKTVVLITCSIHATEIASTHTAVEFAYRLLTEDTPHNRAILDNTILILVPSLNPDGVDIVTRWYRKTLGTPLRRHLAAGALPQVRRATTTIATGTCSRSRKPAHRLQAAQRLASADRLRRAPAWAQRRPHLRAAVARSDRAQHRPHPHAGDAT